MDGDSNKQIKIFLYLNDVDLESGPLTVLSKKFQKNIYNILKKEKNCKKTNRVEDNSIKELNFENFLKPLCGKTGTINFVDTSNCYHFGSRPGKRKDFWFYISF